MSAEKRRGTAWETAVVRYLNANGFEHAERRALTGRHDRGDVAGIPGVVLECKDHARLDLAGWVEEARTEAANAGAGIYAVVAKRRGKNAREAYAVMPLHVLAALLQAAGF